MIATMGTMGVAFGEAPQGTLSTQPTIEATAVATVDEAMQPTPTQEPIPELHADFQEHYDDNRDIIGWLKAGENIDYPIVQADNEFYLDHDYEGKYDSNGTLFLNMNNQLWPRDEVLLIHGHNMLSGAMFGRLMKYEKYDYLCKYPVVEFRTIYDDEAVYYAPISAFNASMLPYNRKYFDITQIVFDDDPDEDGTNVGEGADTADGETVRKSTELQTYLDALQEWSLWESPVDVNVDDELLMLVTCSYYHDDGRFVLVCRKLRSDETRESVEALFTAE